MAVRSDGLVLHGLLWYPANESRVPGVLFIHGRGCTPQSECDTREPKIRELGRLSRSTATPSSSCFAGVRDSRQTSARRPVNCSAERAASTAPRPPTPCRSACSRPSNSRTLLQASPFSPLCGARRFPQTRGGRAFVRRLTVPLACRTRPQPQSRGCIWRSCSKLGPLLSPSQPTHAGGPASPSASPPALRLQRLLDSPRQRTCCRLEARRRSLSSRNSPREWIGI